MRSPREDRFCEECHLDIGRLERLVQLLKARSRGRSHLFRFWLLRVQERLRLAGFHPNKNFYEIDHRIPRILGGTDSPENLRVLCWPCHRENTARLARYRSNRRRLKRRFFPHTYLP